MCNKAKEMAPPCNKTTGDHSFIPSPSNLTIIVTSSSWTLLKHSHHDSDHHTPTWTLCSTVGPTKLPFSYPLTTRLRPSSSSSAPSSTPFATSSSTLFFDWGLVRGPRSAPGSIPTTLNRSNQHWPFSLYYKQRAGNVCNYAIVGNRHVCKKCCYACNAPKLCMCMQCLCMRVYM